MAKLCYWEIPATDGKRSAEFYSRLFGWKMGSSSESYIMFDVEGGISKVEKMTGPCIDVYIAVDEIAATLRKAETLGARTERPKTEIGGGYGYYAFLRDPCGCRSGLWSKE